MGEPSPPLQRLLQCVLCGFTQAGNPHEPPCCPQHPERALVAQRWLLAGPKDFMLGARLGGKYVLTQPLGQGQFGRVYLALQEGAPGVVTRVAVKVLREDRAEMHALFLDEVRVVSRFRSQHIAQYLDSGFDREHGLTYLVMELVEGETLAALLEREGRVELKRAVEMTAQLLVALEEAHAAGVIHRDLKPANLMLTRCDGVETLKVLDFGVSRPNASQPREQTQGLIPGTPAYMAPELFLGYTGSLSAEMDLFSVGVVLFQLLSGHLPFEVEGDADHLIGYYKLYSHRPRPAGLEGVGERRLEQVLAQALSVDPRRRFGSAREMLEALAPWSELAARALRERPAPPPQEPRRSRWVWLVAAAVLGGLIGLAAHFSRVWFPAQGAERAPASSVGAEL